MHTSPFQRKMELIPYNNEYETELSEAERNMLLFCTGAAAILVCISILDEMCKKPQHEPESPEPEAKPSEAIVVYQKPTLRSRPTKAPKTDNVDILDKPILGHLWHWPGGTAKQIAAALRNTPGGADKHLINSRLYTLMAKGLVTKMATTTSAPRWLPVRGADLNAYVFGR